MQNRPTKTLIFCPTRFAPGLFLALLSACATPAKVPALPLNASVESYVGNVLTGPLTDTADTEAEPWAVEIRISTVDDLPATLGDPISSIVRQVFVRGKEGPLQTRSELALDIR
ncbi:MAG: hypothetical protein ACI8X5_002613, partial [Planctomycetota bacterium]